jgi:hypothetical protein
MVDTGIASVHLVPTVFPRPGFSLSLKHNIVPALIGVVSCFSLFVLATVAFASFCVVCLGGSLSCTKQFQAFHHEHKQHETATETNLQTHDQTQRTSEPYGTENLL